MDIKNKKILDYECINTNSKDDLVLRSSKGVILFLKKDTWDYLRYLKSDGMSVDHFINLCEQRRNELSLQRFVEYAVREIWKSECAGNEITQLQVVRCVNFLQHRLSDVSEHQF